MTHVVVDFKCTDMRRKIDNSNHTYRFKENFVTKKSILQSLVSYVYF